MGLAGYGIVGVLLVALVGALLVLRARRTTAPGSSDAAWAAPVPMHAEPVRAMAAAGAAPSAEPPAMWLPQPQPPATWRPAD